MKFFVSFVAPMYLFAAMVVGVIQHRDNRTILVAPRGVEVLQLGQESTVTVFGESAELNEGCAPDQPAGVSRDPGHGCLIVGTHALGQDGTMGVRRLFRYGAAYFTVLAAACGALSPDPEEMASQLPPARDLGPAAAQPTCFFEQSCSRRNDGEPLKCRATDHSRKVDARDPHDPDLHSGDLQLCTSLPL